MHFATRIEWDEGSYVIATVWPFFFPSTDQTSFANNTVF